MFDSVLINFVFFFSKQAEEEARALQKKIQTIENDLDQTQEALMQVNAKLEEKDKALQNVSNRNLLHEQNFRKFFNISYRQYILNNAKKNSTDYRLYYLHLNEYESLEYIYEHSSHMRI